MIVLYSNKLELVKNENKLLQEEVEHYKSKIRYGIEMRASMRPPNSYLQNRSRSPRNNVRGNLYQRVICYLIIL